MSVTAPERHDEDVFYEFFNKSTVGLQMVISNINTPQIVRVEARTAHDAIIRMLAAIKSADSWR